MAASPSELVDLLSFPIVPHDGFHLGKLALQQPEQIADNVDGDGEVILLDDIRNQNIYDSCIAVQGA